VAARRFVVSGRVQGVGFRYFTVRAARRLGLVGWVRNLTDGRVEAHAEGEAEALESFRASIEKGPPGSVVRGIEAAEVEPSGAFREFSVEF